MTLVTTVTSANKVIKVFWRATAQDKTNLIDGQHPVGEMFAVVTPRLQPFTKPTITRATVHNCDNYSS